MPHSPLYHSHLFPTFQMLLSRSPTNLPVVAVTADSFRKHILRLKPELKRLVPALAQAEAEADCEAADDARHASGSSDQEALSAPAQSPVREGAAVSDGAHAADPGGATAATIKGSKKQKLAVAVREGGESSDDDLPLWHKLHGNMKTQNREKTSCDTPPSEPASPPRSALHAQTLPAVSPASAQQAPRHSGSSGRPRLHPHLSVPSPKTPDTSSQASSEQVLAGNVLSYTCAREGRAGGSSYGRKRWKVVGLYEKRRKDGSWGMTLRLRRKRSK